MTTNPNAQEETGSALRSIPDHLLRRVRDPNRDMERAIQLVNYCEARGFRPTFLDIDLERQRREQVSPEREASRG